MNDYIHLHVHTYYSILDGQSPIKRLVDKAVADGQRGLAITDHGNMFGIKEFADYVDKVNKKLESDGKAPFKPIFGCEMYVARRTRFDKVRDMGDMSGYHLVVLAKNYNGYKNLIKLVSNAWIDGYYMRPRTDRGDLEKYHEDLIVASACLAGEVPRKILAGDIAGARESIEWHKRVFGDDYYLELQRHEVTDPTIRANREVYPSQQRVNKVILELAKEYNVKVICTNDVHFVDQENAEAHDHLLCLSTGKDLDDPNRMLYSKQEWFKSREEMTKVFGDLPETMTNTIEILDKVETYSINHAPIMPNFPIPNSFGIEDEWRHKYTEHDLYHEFTTDENGENPMSEADGKKRIEQLGGIEKLYRLKFEADYLKHLAYEGAKQLYPQPLSKEVDDRIRFELHIMKTMGFPGYFLIVQDFINAARKELNVMVGPGRGSAAGSVVAFCLGITKIDPMQYDLLFERFLNPDRISLPDIDTDFDDDGRARVLKWVEKKYGKENCAHIITYGSMATKNSLKDVARVERLPLERVNALCKAIPDKLSDGLKMNLTNAIKCVPELQKAEISADLRESNTIKYAKMLEGTVRNTGIHACGIIICRDPISNWVPVSTADDPDFKDQKTNCTQYDGHVIEDTGLIKMDFLGLKTLSEMKEAVHNIKLSRGIEVNLDTIPIDDELTYQLYQRGQTIGTFQFESVGMQNHLRQLKPTKFEDLIAMNALYRPGPMDNIPSFIARKKGDEAISYPIPIMEKYLKDTYGITVYQEQVMLLSRLLGNFTRGESDALRKAMGKKKKEIVDAMKPKFIKGGTKNGYDAKILEGIWADWEKFASYAFNKSHAACYSWVAFQTAYLKAHYPAEFMAAIMSRRKDDITEVSKLMEECKSLGIATLGPDVNESYQKFGVNKKGEIRFGLAAIKGIGNTAAEAIIKEREENGAYQNIFDFAQRTNYSCVNKKIFEYLALSGAFDNFGIRRENYFGLNAKGEQFIETLVKYGQLYQSKKNELQQSLFGGENAVEMITPPIPEAEEWSNIERLNEEVKLIGIYLSAHPLDEFKLVLNNMCNTTCTELKETDELLKRSELSFGGIVTSVVNRFTKTGKPFGRVVIEDFSGSGELSIFGEDWGKWKGMLTENSTVYVKAKFFQKYPNSTFYDFRINDIQYLQTVNEKYVEKITIVMNSDTMTDVMAEELMTLLQENVGKVQLFFRVNDYKTQSSVTLYSQLSGIELSGNLLRYLDEHNDLSYIVN